MNSILKEKYPFRLGTTSFIYPADYAFNIEKLAPMLDEIELLLFESNNLPSCQEIEELNTLAHHHNITYNVHLPMDANLTADSPEIRQQAIASIVKAIDRVAPLTPTTHTLHLDFHQSKKQEMVKDWQLRALHSMTRLLESSGILAERISVETLDYSPFWLQPIVEQLGLSVCVDVGHIILYGFDLMKVLDLFASRITILHLHGVSAKRDHLSLTHLGPDDRYIISHYLNNYTQSASIEVFNYKRLDESMACFPELMELAETAPPPLEVTVVETKK